MPLFQEYNFSENNPMFDVNNPLARGKEFLEEGDLPSAVLCFEAAVKKEPESVEAWFLLGNTQAENEQVQAKEVQNLINLHNFILGSKRHMCLKTMFSFRSNKFISLNGFSC